MLQSFVRSAMRKIAPLAVGATALGASFAGSPAAASVATLPIPHPLISDATAPAAALVKRYSLRRYVGSHAVIPYALNSPRNVHEAR